MQELEEIKQELINITHYDSNSMIKVLIDKIEEIQSDTYILCWDIDWVKERAQYHNDVALNDKQAREIIQLFDYHDCVTDSDFQQIIDSYSNEHV